MHLRVEPAHFDWRWRERPALALLAWEASLAVRWRSYAAPKWSQLEPFAAIAVWTSAGWERAMDEHTKHEILLLTIGTMILEVPAAIAAFVILSH